MSEMGKLRESRKSRPSPSSVLTNNISNNMYNTTYVMHMSHVCGACSVSCEDAGEEVPKTIVNTQELSSKNFKSPKPVDNPVVTGIWADMDRKNTI